MKYVHWVDLVIGALGCVMLVNLLSGIGIDTRPITQTVFLVFIVFIGPFILFVIYWYGIRRKRLEVQVDERVRAITDKSARNGFIATWLGMFIFVDFGAPDANSLLVVVAAGLVVYIVSEFIYHFKYYWMTIVITVIGTIMLTSLLEEVGIETKTLLLPLPLVFTGLFLLFVIYKYGIRREKVEWIVIDERVQAVVDKSARNGFIVTWLCMLIFVDFEAPDANSLLVVVAAGLVVFMTSLFVYYYKRG